MRLHEEAVPPGISAAGEGLGFVVGAEIAEDTGAGGIGGANFGLTVEHAVELVKIDRLRVLPALNFYCNTRNPAR